MFHSEKSSIYKPNTDSLSSESLPSSVVRHRVEFARDVGRNPLREPDLAQLVVPLLVQELREL